MKKYLITGLLVWVPLAITMWVLDLIIGTMDRTLLLLPDEWQPDRLLHMHLPGLGMILTVLVPIMRRAAREIGRRRVLLTLDERRKRPAEDGHAPPGGGFDWGVLFAFGPGPTVETVVLPSVPITAGSAV